jgi:O-antigen/teichoic acid export membrane protein
VNIKGYIFNFISAATPAVLSLLLMPFYLSVLGQEGLGLVALLSLSLMVFGIFSAGAGRLLQREIVAASSGNRRHLLTKVVRRGWWLYGIMAVAGLVVLIPLALHYSVSAQRTALHLPHDQIRRCFLMMAGMAAVSFVYGYAGVILAALGKLAQASQITFGVSIVTAMASVILLNKWPRMDVFYGIQAIALLVAVGVAVLLARRAVFAVEIPSAAEASGAVEAMLPLGQFVRESSSLVVAEGMNALITQMDRFLISAYLPLSAMGSYSLGSTLGRLVTMVSGPLQLAVAPSICRLDSERHQVAVRSEYVWRLFFVCAVLVSLVALPLWSAPFEILQLWIRNDSLDLGVPAWVLRWTVTGNGLMALGAIFYSYNVACRRNKSAMVLGAASLLILPVAGYFAVMAAGAAGASACWALYGMAYLITAIYGAAQGGLPARFGRRWQLRSLFVFTVTLILTIGLQFCHGGAMLKVLLSLAACLLVLLCAAAVSLRGFGNDWRMSLDIKVV